MDLTNPFSLAKRCLLGDGLIVPVDEADEAEDAEDESSSAVDSGKDWSWSSALSSSRNVFEGKGGSKGRPASFALAKER